MKRGFLPGMIACTIFPLAVAQAEVSVRLADPVPFLEYVIEIPAAEFGVANDELLILNVMASSSGEVRSLGGAIQSPRGSGSCEPVCWTNEATGGRFCLYPVGCGTNGGGDGSGGGIAPVLTTAPILVELLQGDGSDPSVILRRLAPGEAERPLTIRIPATEAASQ